MKKAVLAEPSGGLWFRHASPYQLEQLRPQSYADLARIRPDYDVQARKDAEHVYHQLTRQSARMSFLYATVVGHNLMEDSLSYPGYTYYFQLTEEQIARCVFDVVAQQSWMRPTLGVEGLRQALRIWQSRHTQFTTYEEAGLGLVEPRVEVVIPFSVTPKRYVPQQEDRPATLRETLVLESSLPAWARW